MADSTPSASTYFSVGTEGATERQFCGCTTVLELNVIIINFFTRVFTVV